MTSGTPIEIRGLSKSFGAVTAIDDLSFRVEPGRVTGFLGPNGAGKTTTLRCLLGLVTASAGTATIGGKPYAEIPTPAREVGAALEATGFHPGRTARDHLRVVAMQGAVAAARVDVVLRQVGLEEAANRRAGQFSLGMRQRLQLATALLGDPGVLVLDEPANGLDPEGIAWLRQFLQMLAEEGRTVLVSSHVLVEVEQTVDDVVIIANGRLIRACPLADLLGDATSRVLVRTPHPDQLIGALSDTTPAAVVRQQPDGSLLIEGVDAAFVGALALRTRVELHELRPEPTDLEQVFLSLTHGESS